jgi:hypothetical protein
MTHPILVLIKRDPTKTHKPVEAIRIALGLIGGEHAVRVVLMDRAPLLLGEDSEELVDGDLLQKYLPSFIDLEQTFYVEDTAWERLDIDPGDYRTEPVSHGRIAELIREADRTLIF